MAPRLLTSIHPVYSGANTRERNGCHTSLNSDYSSMNKFLLVCECGIALERYCIWWELLQAATSAREALNHSELVHLSFVCSQSLSGCSGLKTSNV